MAEFDDARTALFWGNVDKDGPVPAHAPQLGPCWEWARCRSAHGGYGRVGGQRAHRYAWTIAYGPIPNGLCVLHRCDNPPCVRPDHLWLGTQVDNMRDKTRKGRGRTGPGSRAGGPRALKGEAHPRARLTESDVRTIRELRAVGVPAALLAKRFQVPRNHIWMIEHRRTWKHI